MHAMHAVAEAFRLACEKGDNVTVSDFDDVFQSEDAFAFAAVRGSNSLSHPVLPPCSTIPQTPQCLPAYLALMSSAIAVTMLVTLIPYQP